MEKEKVIAFRENAKINNQQIFIYVDNALVFYDGLRDCEYLIWDDTNEKVTIFGPIRENFITNSFYRRSETPYEMYVLSYSEIQGIGVYMNYEVLSKEVATMVSNGLITAEKGNEMLKNMAPLSRANVNSIERTMRTYNQEDYKEYLESKSNS